MKLTEMVAGTFVELIYSSKNNKMMTRQIIVLGRVSGSHTLVKVMDVAPLGDQELTENGGYPLKHFCDLHVDKIQEIIGPQNKDWAKRVGPFFATVAYKETCDRGFKTLHIPFYIDNFDLKIAITIDSFGTFCSISNGESRIPFVNLNDMLSIIKVLER